MEREFKADAFVRPIYCPKSVETEEAVKEFLRRLGLGTRDQHVAALSCAIAGAASIAAAMAGRMIFMPALLSRRA